MNLVTPDATRRVRSTFPPVSPPPPSPLRVLFTQPTIHPPLLSYRPPFVSSMTRRGRRNVTKVRGSKPLIVACSSFFFFFSNDELSFIREF